MRGWQVRTQLGPDTAAGRQIRCEQKWPPVDQTIRPLYKAVLLYPDYDRLCIYEHEQTMNRLCLNQSMLGGF